MSGSSEKTWGLMDRIVHLDRIIERDLNIHIEVARRFIAHGSVKIDGVTISHTQTFTVGDLYGKMLTVGRRECRLFGSRLAPTGVFADDATPQLGLDV